MNQLKLGAFEDDRPVKLMIELPAIVLRNLVAYADPNRSMSLSVHSSTEV